jgi:hypothetical protein
MRIGIVYLQEPSSIRITAVLSKPWNTNGAEDSILEWKTSKYRNDEYELQVNSNLFQRAEYLTPANIASLPLHVKIRGKLLFWRDDGLSVDLGEVLFAIEEHLASSG